MTDTEIDIAEIVELSEQESDWSMWQSSGNLPAEVTYRCDCGHNTLGPDWHMRECPANGPLWRYRAKQLHDEVWALRRKLPGEPEPDLGFSIDQRCGCGRHADHVPVRYHRRGSSDCRAGIELKGSP